MIGGRRLLRLVGRTIKVALGLFVCWYVLVVASQIFPSLALPYRRVSQLFKPVADPNEDLFEFITKIPCPIMYSDGPFTYCYREIDAFAESLPKDSGPWTLDRLVEAHFKDSEPCPEIRGVQTANGIEAYWPKAGPPQCYEIRNGRVMLIGASRRPEAAWFLGNELGSRSEWSAIQAINAYYSEYGPCCEGFFDNCPVSAGTSECFEDYPANKWWNAHQNALSRHEPWRVRLLEKAGFSAEEYKKKLRRVGAGVG